MIALAPLAAKMAAWAIPWAAKGLVAVGLPWVNPIRALRWVAVLVALVPVVWLGWTIGSIVHDGYAAREMEATRRAAGLQAEANALRAALDQQQQTLLVRDRQLQIADDAATALEKQNKELRDASPNKNDMVFAADDPWFVGRGPGGMRRKPATRDGDAARAGRARP